MADESRWDEDERRRRWEEERYRRGGQYGREGQYGSESQYAREGWREMTGRDRDWRGGGGFGESRPQSYGGYDQGRGAGYGYGGSYSGEGWRGGQSQNYGAMNREYRESGYDPRASHPAAREGYVGMGPDQGFWRTPEHEQYGREWPPYNRGGSFSAYGGYGAERERDYGRREQPGFFQRAGEEVASWFGNDERERGHRGRGPRGYTRSDERIREDVCDRLAEDPVIDASDIEIQVSGGEVTLNGHVHSRWLKRRAEDLADDISGVKHVQNNLRVKEWGSEASGMESQQRIGDTSSTATLSGQPARRKP